MSNEVNHVPVHFIERTGMAGKWRSAAAGLLGCGLWVGMLLVYIDLRMGSEPPSLIELLFVILITAAVSVAPLILSQMTRGRWVLEENGVSEKITPLVPFLPLGLNRQRFVKWGDIESCGVYRIRVTRDVYHDFFRAEISGQPRIEISRKKAPLDPEFTDFAAEFLRLAKRQAE